MAADGRSYGRVVPEQPEPNPPPGAQRQSAGARAGATPPPRPGPPGRVVLDGRATIDIARPAAEILDWVLELDGYARADRKFGRIHEVVDHGDTGTARYSARFRGVPTPADTQRWWRSADGRRLDFRSSPSYNARHVAWFEGWFVCDERPGATRVTHVERLHVHRPFATPLRWWLGSWWAAEVPGELARMRELLGAA